MRYLTRSFIFWIASLLLIIPFFSFSASNVNVYLPIWTREKDVNIDNTKVQTKESTIFEYIQIINYYLWFSIAWVAMAVLIYAWILMITAWWDKAKVSKWWKLALSCLIAIMVAMLSYLLVKLVISLF